MAVQAILDSLDSYTGELESLNAFVQTAADELGADWTDKIYDALGELTDTQREKLDHAFNYYAATTAWNEIQSYLTHDGPLNYQETVERLPILEHWLAFFGAAGEEVVSSLKSRLKLEGAAAARDTSVLDDPFAGMPAADAHSRSAAVSGQDGLTSQVGSPQNTEPSNEESIMDAQYETLPNDSVQGTISQHSDIIPPPESSLNMTSNESLQESEENKNGVFLEAELENADMGRRINNIFSDDSSFEQTHKIVGSNSDMSSEEIVEPDTIIDKRPEVLTARAVEGDVLPGQVEQALKETSDRERDNIFEESDLNDFFQAATPVSQKDVQGLSNPTSFNTHQGESTDSQSFLQENYPQNLQLIDETVTNAAQTVQNKVIGQDFETKENVSQDLNSDENSMDEFFAATRSSQEMPVTLSEQRNSAVTTTASGETQITPSAAEKSIIDNDEMVVPVIKEQIEPSQTPTVQNESFMGNDAVGLNHVGTEETEIQHFNTSDVTLQAGVMSQASAVGGASRPQRLQTQSVEEFIPDEHPVQQTPVIEQSQTPVKPSHTLNQDISQRIDKEEVASHEDVRLTPESEEEFKVNRLLRQIDFKTAVQAWISARCIELGYTNNYTYRYYGFLVDVMDRTIEEIKSVLQDESLYVFVEQRKHDGIHFLQNQLIALEKESKDAHDRITSDLSPLPREGLSTDDVRKALGQMDLSGEKEYLGPAPDGFEMLEDPYQNLDEATVKKEYAKIEAEADLPPAEPIKQIDPSDLKKPIISTKSASQTPQNGVQRKMSFSFGKKTTPTGTNNS